MTQITKSRLTSLILWAKQNNIDEKYLPRDIQNLKNLEVLKLHDLNLKQLPDEIGILTNLRELYLSYNQLTQLPDTIGQLINLEILWIQGNQLSFLPNSLTSLAKLKELAAFDNNLICLPESIQSMTALTDLFLHSNCLDEHTCKEVLAHLTLNRLSLYKQKIHVLDESTFTPALELRNHIFDNLDSLEYDTLKASLNMKANLPWAKKIGIEKLQYWVAVNTEAEGIQDVQGIVGLYTNIDTPKHVWLGWYGVNPEARGRNIGSTLLNFAIATAKLQGYEELHLYTTTDNVYIKARNMYQKRGFNMYKKEKNGTLYYKHHLNENY